MGFSYISSKEAFNNVKTDSVRGVLGELGVEMLIINWVLKKVERWLVTLPRREGAEKCQKEEICPEYCGVIITILSTRRRRRINIIAYVDDVAILTTRIDLWTITHIMEASIKETPLLAGDNGLGSTMTRSNSYCLQEATKYLVIDLEVKKLALRGSEIRWVHFGLQTLMEEQRRREGRRE